MSRFKIIILIFVIAASVVGYLLYHNLSQTTVTLNAKNSTYTLYNSVDKKTITEISSLTTLKLRDGYYCGVAKDSKYDNKPLCFGVYKLNTSYTFDADYSSNYLKELLPKEKDDIAAVINSRYKNIIKNYTVCEGSLYGKGDLYGAAIVENPVYASDNTDVYRVVLKKKGNVWEIVKNPVIVLDKKTFSNIPFDTLKAINTADVCQPKAGISSPSQSLIPLDQGSTPAD